MVLTWARLSTSMLPSTLSVSENCMSSGCAMLAWKLTYHFVAHATDLRIILIAHESIGAVCLGHVFILHNVSRDLTLIVLKI